MSNLNFKQAEDLLEYRRVLELAGEYTHTSAGAEIIIGSKPIFNKNIIIESGELVTQAKNILINHDIPPFKFIPNLTDPIRKSKISGVVLNSESILSILNLAEVSRRLFQFLKNNSPDSFLFNKYSEKLFVDKLFEHHISNIFTETGEIRDSASDELRKIRRSIIDKSDQLRKSVNRILKRLSESYLVQEEFVTLKDSRIVIPIKAEHKRHVKGFIHSESASGHTVYIEPEETLELNNEILSLSFAEKREIERILKSLTVKIGEMSEPLLISFRTVAELDAIFAKAQYSIEVIGAFPTIDNSRSFHMIEGRHPILIKKLGRGNTVPLNLKLENDNVVLITGPNAGGKTVVLKTIGLLQLLLQSGFHIPVDPDSNFHIYEKILLDIGDQQSIEDDLSTFSSHLKNINEIINESDKNSLVLLDEIGTGTDPAEGSALATSILIQLKNSNAIIFATTHHGNLKIIANELEGFQNASMIFDTKNLKPTYIFSQGMPGSSYAFEVAQRIGLSRKVIDTAKRYVDSDKTKIEDLLIDLEKKSNDLKDKLNYYERENSRLEGLTTLYAKQVEKLENEKRIIINKAREEADLYLTQVNRKVENAIKQIKESNADKNVIKTERKIIDELKLKNVEGRVDERANVKSNVVFEIGDFVQLIGSETRGQILELDKKKAIVRSGNLKISVRQNELLKIKEKELKENYSYIPSYSSEYLSSRIDIRGKKPEEIEFELVKYLDDAYTNNLQSVEIVHGKGTGVLKKAVHEILDKHEAIKNYYFAKIELGGEGVTIVNLK